MMVKLLDRLLNSARKYTIFDYSCLKITLISLGMILGAYFSKFILSNIDFLWVIFTLSLIYILYSTIKNID